MEHFTCKYCGKECLNLNSLRQHEVRCKENPDRKVSWLERYNYTKHPPHNQYTKAQRLGNPKPELSAESRERMAAAWKGKHLTDEMKNKISNSLSNYYLENPEKIPYRLWHSSDVSYPEQYFKDVFEEENIDLKYHLQIGLYELDFYNEEHKTYVEIDGATHYKKHVQEIDKRKDAYLSSLGWKGMRIKWDEYKKLSFEEKRDVIETIKLFVSSK